MDLATELCEAIEAHDLKRVAKCLADGADPNVGRPDEPAFPPIKHAVEELHFGGPIESIPLLLRAGADADGGREIDGSVTALWLAAEYSQTEAARLLIAAGADITFQAEISQTPLTIAVSKDNYALVEMLLLAGATTIINDYGGYASLTPLGDAAFKLDLRMIELLLSYGADPLALGMDGYSALEILERQHFEKGHSDEFLKAKQMLHSKLP